MRLRLPWHKPAPAAPPPPQANPVRIAMLERDLLGIHPEPGSSIAHAVAAATPVDPSTCAHSEVIETTTWGHARPVGMCARCGAGMVENEHGDWAPT